MTRVEHSSKKMDWETPPEIFGPLNAEFCFRIDLAAERNNAKCDAWIPPSADSLSAGWAGLLHGEWGWLNPPYSRGLGKWVAKAAGERRCGANIVMLIPARPDTRYWAEHIWDHALHRPRPGVDVRFLKGRVKFVGATAGAPFPSAVVVFRGAT